MVYMTVVLVVAAFAPVSTVTLPAGRICQLAGFAVASCMRFSCLRALSSCLLWCCCLSGGHHPTKACKPGLECGRVCVLRIHSAWRNESEWYGITALLYSPSIWHGTWLCRVLVTGIGQCPGAWQLLQMLVQGCITAGDVVMVARGRVSLLPYANKPCRVFSRPCSVCGVVFRPLISSPSGLHRTVWAFGTGMKQE